MKQLVAPSILAADFGNLGRDIEMLNSSDADWIHCDIMDGVFVPNISFGMPVLKYVQKIAKKPLDVHLMIVDPDRYIESFREHGASVLTVHYEACKHLNRTVNAIQSLGMKAGVSLNPHTPVSVLEDILEYADMILLMTVNPGFGAQKFISNSFDRIKKLRQMIVSKNTNTMIEVDGGIDLSNAQRLYESGVDILVAGNSVFTSADPAATISKLKKAKS